MKEPVEGGVPQDQWGHVEHQKKHQQYPVHGEVISGRSHQNKKGCEHCGLKNHQSEDCRRRNACELCGLNNHGSYECKREPLWNEGPKLCAAQVHNQSFFYIEEQIDQKITRDRASFAIITMIRGELTAKQLEMEFTSIISAETWRWSARKMSEGKFVMRFPNAKMIQDYSKFNLGMKKVDAQITVEPWLSSIGAKGKLQEAWFKVSGIPVDQRGIRTIAKVGGLVGKTISIDENTRYNPEYVRVKIACKEIAEVPESVEGNLWMFIFEFFYEREETKGEKEARMKSGVRVGEQGNQPSPKKMKTGHAGARHPNKTLTKVMGVLWGENKIWAKPIALHHQKSMMRNLHMKGRTWFLQLLMNQLIVVMTFNYK
jgi:hypothetical protein